MAFHLFHLRVLISKGLRQGDDIFHIQNHGERPWLQFSRAYLRLFVVVNFAPYLPEWRGQVQAIVPVQVFWIFFPGIFKAVIFVY